jgi:hypothetical protein
MCDSAEPSRTPLATLLSKVGVPHSEFEAMHPWTQKEILKVAELLMASDPAAVTTQGSGSGASTAVALGSKWLSLGTSAPSSGRELTNAKLSFALKRSTLFSEDDLRNFELPTLQPGDYIKSGSSYFQAAVPAVELDEKLAELYCLNGIKDLRMLRVALDKAGGNVSAAFRLFQMRSRGDALVALYKEWGVPFDEHARGCLHPDVLHQLEQLEAKRALEQEENDARRMPAGLNASMVAAAAQRAVALAALGRSTHHQPFEDEQEDSGPSRIRAVEADLELLLDAATDKAGHPRDIEIQRALGVTACVPQHTLSRYVESRVNTSLLARRVCEELRT